MPTPRFRVPLLKAPPDLVEIDPGSVAGLDPTFRFARRTPAGLVEHPDRAAIEAGALAGQNLALVYVADPVDAFFIHIQGAARIRLGDGRTMRVTYAAKSGQPYTPIGRVLLEMGALKKGDVTMATIRAWLGAHPEEARRVMAQNRSYIFFREAPVADPSDGPIAAAKVPLTAGRSLAVDRLIHSFHTPVWVETKRPDGSAFRQLMVAQDTGTAIVGPSRGDIFFGSGAGSGRHRGRDERARPVRASRAAGGRLVSRKRTPSDDELALWQKVAETAKPLRPVAGRAPADGASARKSSATRPAARLATAEAGRAKAAAACRARPAHARARGARFDRHRPAARSSRHDAGCGASPAREIPSRRAGGRRTAGAGHHRQGPRGGRRCL